MADQIDRAQELADEFNANGHRKYPRVAMPFTWHCYWCDGEITQGNFCGPSCRDDYERDKARRQ